MKTQLVKPALILTTAAAATLFTGCASMGNHSGYSGLNEPVNTLAYTTVTEPDELVKWTGSKWTLQGIRSMDLYYFRVPDTGYQPGSVNLATDFDRSDNYNSARSNMNSDQFDSVGASPGMYQSDSGSGSSESGSVKTIRHQPGEAR